MNGKEFLGRGFKFPLQVDRQTGRIAMVDYEDDIREAIGIILRTGRGERVMRPDFGADPMQYAFANLSDTMIHTMIRDLTRVLLEQEPRICDVELRPRQTDGNDGALVLEVAYTVRSTNNRYNQVYPFYRTEGSQGGESQ